MACRSIHTGQMLSHSAQTNTNRSENDASRSTCCNSGGEGELCSTQLWHACAGSIVTVPCTGEVVFYFPQGHMEQVEAYADHEGDVEMPIYNLPPKILCKVVHVQLKAEPCTDEVFAQIVLVPEEKVSFPVSGFHIVSLSDFGTGDNGLKHQTSQRWTQKSKAYAFSKKLTPSDTSTHGGFSVPKRHADECFPPLDMSQEPPAQELVAKDLHGSEWRFRHVYRGQPKRHLLTSGWGTFVNAKKLVPGDACVFLRGENGLYVGVHHAAKPQASVSASVLSGHSMQHGILASAFHAISTGTMFTVYYRPWTSPAEFIIPHNQYMVSTNNDFSVGTKFRMQFDDEECSEQRRARYEGTIVGVENIDNIRWRGSEWRCLKVHWDRAPLTQMLPERVSPWNIEPLEIKKKKGTSKISDGKRTRLSNSSNPGIPGLVREGFLKGLEHPPKTRLEVLQGQETRPLNTPTLDAIGQPHSSHFPQCNPDCFKRKIGTEDHTHFLMDQFYYYPASTKPDPGKNIEVSNSASFPKSRPTTSLSQDLKAVEGKDESKVSSPNQPTNKLKCMLFGVNISSCPSELPSQQVLSSTELHGLSPAHPEPSDGIFGNHCCSIGSRSCTKVLKYGTALGRSVELARFDGFDELVCELDRMFDFQGSLIDGISGWHITCTDGDGNPILHGDHQWMEFRTKVHKMFICPKQVAHNFDLNQANQPPA